MVLKVVFNAIISKENLKKHLQKLRTIETALDDKIISLLSANEVAVLDLCDIVHDTCTLTEAQT